MNITQIIALILFICGFICILLSAVGVLRFPTFLSRLHASGVGETLGMMLFCIGFAVSEGMSLVSLKILFILIIMLMVNPVGTHLIAKAERRSGRLDDIEITEAESGVSKLVPEQKGGSNV